MYDGRVKYTRSIEGLEKGDFYHEVAPWWHPWIKTYEVLASDHTGSQAIVTLDVERKGEILQKRYRLGTTILITAGPSYDHRCRIDQKPCSKCGRA